MSAPGRLASLAKSFLEPPPDYGGVKRYALFRDFAALALSALAASALLLPFLPGSEGAAPFYPCMIMWFTLSRMLSGADMAKLSRLASLLTLAACLGFLSAFLQLSLPQWRLPALMAFCAACFVARGLKPSLTPLAVCALLSGLFGSMLLAKFSLGYTLAGVFCAWLGFALALAFLKPQDLRAAGRSLARSAFVQTASALDALEKGMEEPGSPLKSLSGEKLEGPRRALESLLLELPPAAPLAQRLSQEGFCMLRLERSVEMAGDAVAGILLKARAGAKDLGVFALALRLGRAAALAPSQNAFELFDRAIAAAEAEHLAGPLPLLGRPFLMGVSLVESLKRVSANLKALLAAREELAR
jgi:hypothetical protein